MKTPIALAATALVPTLAHAGLDNGANPIHPLVGVAITGGGDKIASVEFQNGGSRDITAGGLVQVWGGVSSETHGNQYPARASSPAETSSEEDEVIVHNVDLALGENLRKTMFNLSAHRRPEHYKLIVERTGAEVTPAND